MYASTFLRERDSLGIVDPIFNSPCLNGERKSRGRIYQPRAMRRGRIPAQHRSQPKCYRKIVQPGLVAV